MTILLLLAAATLPEPLVPALDAAETSEVIRGHRAAILYARHDVVIGPDGRARKCTLLRSSGVPQFDDHVCASWLKVGRFKPAKSDSGEPAYGVFQLRTVWLPGPGKPGLPRTPADIQLSIRPVAGLKLPTEVSVILTVNAEGRIANCQGGLKASPKIVPTACAQARRLPLQPLVLDDKGQPTEYVRNVTVGFASELQTK